MMKASAMTKRQRQEAVEWGVLVAVLAFELLLIPRLHVPRAVIVLLYGLSIAALVWVVWRSSGRDIRDIEDAWERETRWFRLGQIRFAPNPEAETHHWGSGGRDAGDGPGYGCENSRCPRCPEILKVEIKGDGGP